MIPSSWGKTKVGVPTKQPTMLGADVTQGSLLIGGTVGLGETYWLVAVLAWERGSAASLQSFLFPF